MHELRMRGLMFEIRIASFWLAREWFLLRLS
jgi:hypothetical protein